MNQTDQRQFNCGHCGGVITISVEPILKIPGILCAEFLRVGGEIPDVAKSGE